MPISTAGPACCEFINSETRSRPLSHWNHGTCLIAFTSGMLSCGWHGTYVPKIQNHPLTEPHTSIRRNEPNCFAKPMNLRLLCRQNNKCENTCRTQTHPMDRHNPALLQTTIKLPNEPNPISGHFVPPVTLPNPPPRSGILSIGAHPP